MPQYNSKVQKQIQWENFNILKDELLIRFINNVNELNFFKSLALSQGYNFSITDKRNGKSAAKCKIFEQM